MPPDIQLKTYSSRKAINGEGRPCGPGAAVAGDYLGHRAVVDAVS